MPETPQLDCSKYGRWLARIASVRCAFAFCDTEGALVWTSHGPEETIVPEAFAILKEQGFAWRLAGDSVQRRDIDENHVLLYRPLGPANGVGLGWVAAVLDCSENRIAPLELDEIAEAMDDVAAAVQDDHRVNLELDGMALELSERYEELHLVYSVDSQIKRHGQSQAVFQALLENCAEHMDVDVAVMVNPDDKLCISATNLSKPIHNLDLVLVEMRGDLFRFIQSSKQPVVMNEKADPRRSYIFTDMPYKVLGCPIFVGDTVTAILVLINHDHKRDFSNSDRKLAEVLANQLSGLTRMYRMVQEMTAFTEQMAAALIECVEAKDPYTRGHSERVHHISMEIGKALDLPEDELVNLFWGSLLHDVGKIGIPDAVLCKPGRLTADEYTFIMVHPERSYEILRHIDRLKEAIPGARHHQEKYDGTGYPHGLKGERIPLHGRIIAVADTYDSITSSRAYRPGRDHEAAMKEIDRVAGSQLDPKLIEVFRQVCASNPEWMNRFGIKRVLQHA
jgi:HD-GYP domain-containing protein (c-di-GMP phosphodiesterase class II)